MFLLNMGLKYSSQLKFLRFTLLVNPESPVVHQEVQDELSLHSCGRHAILPSPHKHFKTCKLTERCTYDNHYLKWMCFATCGANITAASHFRTGLFLPKWIISYWSDPRFGMTEKAQGGWFLIGNKKKIAKLLAIQMRSYQNRKI